MGGGGDDYGTFRGVGQLFSTLVTLAEFAQSNTHKVIKISITAIAKLGQLMGTLLF